MLLKLYTKYCFNDLKISFDRALLDALAMRIETNTLNAVPLIEMLVAVILLSSQKDLLQLC